MPKQDCLICATDEGSFVDVFTHGKGFHDIIENYLSLEVQKDKLLSTKICYKCAYELTQCNEFVEKFNQAHEGKKKKSSQRGHCNLCSELGKKGFTFELRNDALDEVCERVKDLFDQDLSSSSKLFSVCLNCRYNLDVLSDLKKVAQNHSTNDTTSKPLPKVNVNVIRRKTTSVPSPSFSDSSDIDTSTSRMSKKKSSKSNSQKDRQCDKCESPIENGIDMYRFHNTGQNVCKDCWVSMDPVKLAKGRKRNTTEESNTKVCTVVLNDVLTIPATQKSKKAKNSVNSEQTKMTTRGKPVYVISDDSEIEESPVKAKKGAKRATSENDTKSTKKAKRDVVIIPQRATRAMSVMSSVSVISCGTSRKPSKRRNSDNFEVPDVEPKRLRGRPSKVVSEPQVEKKDDKKTKKTVGKSKAPVPAKSKTPKKLSPSKTVSSSDEGAKKSQRIAKSSSQKSDKSDSPSPSRGSNFSSSQKGKLQKDKTSNVEGTSRRSQRMRKPTKFWSEASESAEDSDDDIQEIISESESNKKSEKSGKTKAPSAHKTTKTAKGSKSRGKGVERNEEDKDEEEADSDGDNQPYTCTICDTEFETKVEGMTHQLTHSKKLGVVLEKVAVSEGTQDDAEKEEKDQQNVSTEVAEDKSIEDSAEAAEASVVTEDAEESQNDEKNVDKNKGPETGAANDSKGSEKSLESGKEPEEGTEAAEHKETEEADKAGSEALPEFNSSNENDPPLRCGEGETEESSKNDGANDADKEVEKEKAEKKEESLMDEKEKLPEKQSEEMSSQESEKDNENSGRKSPVTSGDKTEGTGNGDSKQLTNGGETPLSQPEEGKNGKEENKMHHKVDEEKVGEQKKVESNGNNEDDTEEVEKGSEQEVEPQEVEKNEEDDDWESDDEKSPEAEPLSPPRRDDSIDGDTEPLPDDEEQDESQRKLMGENNGEDVDKVEELELNSNGQKFEGNHSKMGKVTDDVANSPEPVTQEPDVEINVDEASMDAIERQMETIVGGKDMRGEHSELNTGDLKQSAHMPATVAPAAGEQVS